MSIFVAENVTVAPHGPWAFTGASVGTEITGGERSAQLTSNVFVTVKPESVTEQDTVVVLSFWNDEVSAGVQMIDVKGSATPVDFIAETPKEDAVDVQVVCDVMSRF